MKFNKVLNETYKTRNISKNKTGRNARYTYSSNGSYNSNGLDDYKIGDKWYSKEDATELLRKKLVDAGIYQAETWSSIDGMYKKAKSLGII